MMKNKIRMNVDPTLLLEHEEWNLCQHFTFCPEFFGLYDADCSIENHAPGTSHWRVL